MHTTFKAANTTLCKHGMRNDCPVEQCRLQVQRTDSSVIYSSAPKMPVPTLAMPVPTNPTMKNVLLSQSRQFGTHDKEPSEICFSQLTNAAHVYPPLDESTASALARASAGGAMITGNLGQAVDGLSFYQGLINSQLLAQKAKIYAMSSQFSIPIPNLDMNSFELPPLPLIAPPVANAFSATTATAITTHKYNGNGVPDEPMLPTAPSAPLLQPVPALYQTEGAPVNLRAIAPGPLSTAAPRQPRQPSLDQPANPGSTHGHVTSTAPKKDDMAYKTTPCRHFAMNNGWCPWGDECGFIHDRGLEWAPSSERTSGRSTPSSATVVGNKSTFPDKTTGSISSKGAHCWGYIQGICPHAERCRYFHPEDTMPYIKYTPCLTWPRCGYPAQQCPLKHPQVDKVTPQQRSQQPITPGATTVVTQFRESNGPRAEVSSGTQVQVFSQPQATSAAVPSPLPVAEGFIIPHDEAYASARLHHYPTAPSPETFSLAPAPPAVRMRRPSEDLAQDQVATALSRLGMRAYHGRARSVSIAVQKLDEELAGMTPRMQVKIGGKGHGRGKSINL